MVDEVRPGQSDQDVTINIYGESTGNAAAPSTTAFDLSSRTPTAAAVVWAITDPAGAVGDLFETPDIGEVVKEILALPAWSAGNSMNIMFGHISGAGCRWAESSTESDGTMTPYLVINLGGAGCTGGGSGVASIGNPLDSAEEDVVAGTMYLDSVRAISGRLSALGVSHGKSILSGAFV
jgi:hypothetical protein